MKKTLLWTVLVGAVTAITLLIVLNLVWERTVHKIEIPGYPGSTVDFFQRYSLLGYKSDYFVRFPSGSETMFGIIPSFVTVEELRLNSSVEYVGKKLTVRGLRGEDVSVSGFSW
jgi:hypothetical protein